MAKKKASPYDSSAGRGTGDFSSGESRLPSPQPGPIRAMPVSKPAEALVGDPPNNSLLGAILVTIFCFPPFGLLAIVYALQVNSRWKRGDESGAEHSADMAEKLTFAAVGMWLILVVVSVIGLIVWYFFGRHKV